MAKLLTKEEWDDVLPPFVKVEIGPRHWSMLQRSIITDWIENNCHNGWFYYDGDRTYVFESMQDLIMLKMWLSPETLAKAQQKIA